jgi:hypothetical protein
MLTSPISSLKTLESGNPGNIPSFYSGIRTGLSLENNLIYRPPLMQNDKELYQALRSPIYDSNWLNGNFIFVILITLNDYFTEPQFVASYDIGSYVFFFFRELVPGIQNQGRNVISRVARICKVS